MCVCMHLCAYVFFFVVVPGPKYQNLHLTCNRSAQSTFLFLCFYIFVLLAVNVLTYLIICVVGSPLRFCGFG